MAGRQAEQDVIGFGAFAKYGLRAGERYCLSDLLCQRAECCGQQMRPCRVRVGMPHADADHHRSQTRGQGNEQRQSHKSRFPQQAGQLAGVTQALQADLQPGRGLQLSQHVGILSQRRFVSAAFGVRELLREVAARGSRIVAEC